MNQIKSHYPRRSKAVTAALAVGALVGVLLMADGLVERPGGNASAVALVNGYPITAQRFAGALRQMIPDQSSGVSLAQARAVLDRLIEEELLLQRGLDIGITASDTAIRKSLVDAMIEKVVSESQPVPGEAALRDFYRHNASYFTGTAAVRVRRMVFGGDDHRARAAAAFAALTSQGWDTVAQQLADADFMQIPTSFVPVTKLQNYLGPGATTQLRTLRVGAYSPPLELAGSSYILLLLDRQPAAAPAFESVAELVLREYQRRADDAALRSYLQSLRDQAEVIIDGEFMAELD
jgi:hypothetical protein